MTSAADVLVQARAAGVELLVLDGRLASRGAATPELRDAIRTNRVALVAMLTGKPEHDLWLRGEVGTCGWCRRSVIEREVVDIGHGVQLHHACGRVVRTPHGVGGTAPRRAG